MRTLRRIGSLVALLAIPLAAPAPALAAAGTITTVVGDGRHGSQSVLNGDGGPATAASLAHPYDAVPDRRGNLFVTDVYRIRKVDARGIISTVAGNSYPGYPQSGNGDGGPAAASQVDPHGLAVDGANNLYLTDWTTNTIRRIDASNGSISTFAGALSADPGAPAAPNGDGGPALGARFYRPNGLAFDSRGNLFVADQFHHRVRRIDGVTGTVTTVAGTGGSTPQGMFAGDGGPAAVALLDTPTDVAVDAAGDIYIADSGNNRVRRIDARTGVIGTVAGTGDPGLPTGPNGDGGPGVGASLYQPSGLTVDAAGNLFVSDMQNHRVRRLDRATGIITTVAGNGEIGVAGGANGDGGLATQAQLHYPMGLALDGSGGLLVADSGHDQVRRVAALAPGASPPPGTPAAGGARGGAGGAAAARSSASRRPTAAGTARTTASTTAPTTPTSTAAASTTTEAADPATHGGGLEALGSAHAHRSSRRDGGGRRLVAGGAILALGGSSTGLLLARRGWRYPPQQGP